MRVQRTRAPGQSFHGRRELHDATSWSVSSHFYFIRPTFGTRRGASDGMRRRWRMHAMRRREVQNGFWQCSLHRLRGWNILDNNRRDSCRDLRRVSCKFQLTARKLSRRCLHLQLGLHRRRRRALHNVSHRHVEERDGFRSMHRLPAVLGRKLCSVY